jgi:hypothetical protein
VSYEEMHFSSQSLARGWHSTKRIVGNAWHGAVGLAKNFDQGMQVGRRLLAATAPIFDQLGYSHGLKPIMGGLQAYARGKVDVMHHVGQMESSLNRIRRQVPEIGL